MRSVSGIADVSINSVAKLLADAGDAFEAFHDVTVRGVRSKLGPLISGSGGGRSLSRPPYHCGSAHLASAPNPLFRTRPRPSIRLSVHRSRQHRLDQFVTSRANKFRTVESCQAPPRAVRIPRAFRAAAIAR